MPFETTAPSSRTAEPKSEVPAFAFVILIAVLILRPQGFFGEKIGQKA